MYTLTEDGYYMNIREVVEDLYPKLHHEEKKDLAFAKSIYELHHGLGTHIRNKYGFWAEDNPFSERWRKNPIIENGIDISPEHPDARSTTVLLFLQQMAKHEIL